MLTLPAWLDVKTPVEFFFFFTITRTPRRTHTSTQTHTHTHLNTHTFTQTRAERHCSSSRPAAWGRSCRGCPRETLVFSIAWPVAVGKKKTEHCLLASQAGLVVVVASEEAHDDTALARWQRRKKARRHRRLRCSTPWVAKARPSRARSWCSPPARKNRPCPSGPLMAATTGHQWEWAERSCRDRRSFLPRS